MGGSQSTNRAAKFSGARRSVRAVKSAPPSSSTARRATSVRNTNRNVKEFSKFWSDAGCMRSNSKSSSTRDSIKRSSSVRRNRAHSTDRGRCIPSSPSANTPFTTPRSQRETLGIDGTPKRQSLRCTSGRNSPFLEVHGVRSRTSSGSVKSITSSTHDVYSDQFNSAAIAAARLKRMSLHTNEFHPHHHQRQSPETPIY